VGEIEREKSRGWLQGEKNLVGRVERRTVAIAGGTGLFRARTGRGSREDPRRSGCGHYSRPVGKRTKKNEEVHIREKGWTENRGPLRCHLATWNKGVERGGGAEVVVV